MKLLMIGAGASTGARPASFGFKSSPPIGKDLLQYLNELWLGFKSNPGANRYETQPFYFPEIFSEHELKMLGALFKLHQRLKATNYEEALTALVAKNRGSKNDERLRTINRFLAFSFIHDQSGGLKPDHFIEREDLYDQIISKLQIDENWVVISLNYDIVFEEALMRNQISFSYPEIKLGDYRCTEPSMVDPIV